MKKIIAIVITLTVLMVSSFALFPVDSANAATSGSPVTTTSLFNKTTHISRTRVTLSAGDTKTISLHTAREAKVNNADIKWSSSDRSVAKVNSKGKITAVSGGKASIKARYKNRTFKCTVTVKGSSFIDIPIGWETDGDTTEKEPYAKLLSNEKNTSVSSEITDASVEFFKGMITEKSNSMVSPVSMILALGMLENGAREDTLKEIEDTIGVSAEDLNSWANTWIGMMNVSTEKTKVSIANSVWYRNDDTLLMKDSYLDTMKNVFNAEISGAPFDETTLNDINSWVKRNTNDMIDSILDRIEKESMLYLINATAFKGTWTKQYGESAIRENETFTNADETESKATMLCSIEEEYLHDGNAVGFRKYYRDGFYFLAILPDGSVEDYVKSMTGDSLKAFISSGETAEVHAYIPQFAYEYTVPSAIEALQALGINTVFDPYTADLKDMAEMANGDNLYANQVIHKTAIELDRYGTRAAAVTAIGIEKATSAPTQKPVYEVRLDRPFVYAIVDSYTNVPLFIGTVQNLGSR